MDYNDKLKLAKEALDSGSYDKETIEYIFPELKESEDERIRKELIEFVKSRLAGFPQCDKYLAWLEKQGEQKPAWSEEGIMRIDNLIAIIENRGYPDYVEYLEKLKYRVQSKQEWSEEDMKMIGTLVAIFEVNYPDSFYKVNPIGTTNMQGIHSSEIIKWLKSIKERVVPQQKQEWSREDSVRMDELCTFIQDYGDNFYCSSLKMIVINWLKSLKPQSQWKPSDEQLDALYDVLNPCDGVDKKALESLYEQLKAL